MPLTTYAPVWDLQVDQSPRVPTENYEETCVSSVREP